MTKYASIKEIKKSLYEKNRLWNNICYYGFYIGWNWVEERPRKIKSFFQRGWRGWADEDTWNLDIYLAEIISRSITYHKYNQTGIPSEFYNDALSEGKTEKAAIKEYYKVLNQIVEGLKAYQDMCNQYKTNEKKYIIQKMKFNKAMDLLKENFHNLND